jgi:hypothetical protein
MSLQASSEHVMSASVPATLPLAGGSGFVRHATGGNASLNERRGIARFCQRS